MYPSTCRPDVYSVLLRAAVDQHEIRSNYAPPRQTSIISRLSHPRAVRDQSGIFTRLFAGGNRIRTIRPAVGDGRFDARDIVFPVTLGSAAILEKDQDFEFCSLQRRGWVPDDCLENLGALWLFERLLVALRGRILPLRFNGLYGRAAPSNASELTGRIGPKHSHGDMVGLIGHSRWCVIEVLLVRDNRIE